MSFKGFLSAYSRPEYLGAAFRCNAPNVERHYCLHPNTLTAALMQRDEASGPLFRPVQWLGDSDSYDGARYGRFVRARTIHRRCLVPLDGFFVWRSDPAQCYYLRPEATDAVFAVAAILDPHHPAKGVPGSHPVILLTVPAPQMMQGMTQQRLPMSLSFTVWARWIKPGELAKNEVEAMARSCDKVRMALQPVGANFSKYKSDDIRCILAEDEIRDRRLKMEV